MTCSQAPPPRPRPHRFLPDRLLRLHDTPRTLSLVALAALTVAAALLNAFATLPLLGAAAFLSGFTFGGLQARAGARWPAAHRPGPRAGVALSRARRAARERASLAPPACKRQECLRACRRAALQHAQLWVCAPAAAPASHAFNTSGWQRRAGGEAELVVLSPPRAAAARASCRP